MDQTEVAKNQKFRGRIMRILAMFYPDPVTVKELQLSLREYGLSYSADLDKHLYYLAEDSDPTSPPYIRIMGGFSRDLKDDDKIYITKAGVKLMEGDITDPGVMV